MTEIILVIILRGNQNDAQKNNKQEHDKALQTIRKIRAMRYCRSSTDALVILISPYLLY